MAFTPKQSLFIQEYLVDKNATKAAVRAGYKEKTAYSMGHELLKNPEILKQIESGLERQRKDAEARAAKRGITKDKWLKELELIAFSDMDDFATIDGTGGLNLVPSADRKPMRGRVVKKISMSRSTSQNDKGGSESLSQSIELWSKERALEIIGKHFGWIKEKVEGEHTLYVEEMKKLEEMSDEELVRMAERAMAVVKGKKA